jgi:hypothetical protein
MDSRLIFRGAKRPPSGKEYRLLTLDVFDTCLIRDFVSQESLWYLLGREIIGQLPGISSPVEFIRLRGSAENDARGQGAVEDITLADVYARLASMCGWDSEQRRKAITLEEEAEYRGLRINPAAPGLLAGTHRTPVCYLTDTPHRAAFIRSCLDAHSLPAGEVLSSGDLGLRKGTGSLFREAINRFSVARDQTLHIGNDLRVDGGGSAVAGVAFAPVFAANPTRYEVALDAATREVGGLLGAVLGGAGRDFRLAESGRSPNALVSVVAGVAGPAVLAAAAWTLLSAQQDNIDILYFVARDGELLLAVAKLLQQELGLATQIECRYLYGSRRAWHLPALTLASDLDLAGVLRRHLFRSRKETLRGLLEQVDISQQEAAEVAPDAVTDVSFDTPLGNRLPAVIDALVSSPELQSLAVARAKEAHEATMAYLAQEKMFSGRQVGLVDIGWHGAASASLVAMAAAQGADVRCYFAGGLCGRESQVAPEDSRAYLIDARNEEPELRPALVHLLESFCAGSGGSTLGYMTADDGQYLPRLAPAESNAATRWGLRAYQDLMCRYAESACRLLAKFEWTVTSDEVNALRPYLIANLRALWNYPTYEEAELWGSFPFEGDSGTGMLGRAVTSRDLAGYLRHFKSAEKRPRFGPWQRAVIARTVGGKRVTDPFASLHVMSPPQRQLLRAKVRSKLGRRPVIQLSDVDVRDGKVTVR